MAHLVSEAHESEADEVDYISREEGRTILNDTTTRHLGIDADEFMKRWDAGDYDDVDEPAVMRAAMLLPLGR